MELTFIGTGSGKTSLERFHTSILISDPNQNLLIDAGDGISKALIASDISVNSIDSIIISHTHADHFAGVASLLTQMKIRARTSPLAIFIHKGFLKFLSEFINVSYLFRETIGFDLKIIGYEFDHMIDVEGDLKILPRKNDHVKKKVELDGYNDLAFVSSSYVIQNKSINLQYTADVGTRSDLYLFSDFRIDYLISESTHIEFKEIVDAVELIKPKKCYLVHIDDETELQKSINSLSDTKKKQFVLTYDGMKLNLSL